MAGTKPGHDGKMSRFLKSAGTTTARSQTRNRTRMGPARNTDPAYNNKAGHNSKAASASGFTQLAMAIIIYGTSALVVDAGLIGAARRR